ncbi:enoyl-CoA hydratase/isomerase family protein [Sphingomonas donggukensis]|uniref:3-hydroxyisobutyryl-CoA hydrolase n=1 Tax=Sphingomonas donggukensis TaxID=2949093 RepID=A0ABY4TUL0_9SPHN|nr:enoyl-CoA hydratase/isomerase family protein [Sphingomonas donggukensis]URW76094.1 enoyl-CoA hydratase/isomerase family protein [Sphingomonas donggukensis]
MTDSIIALREGAAARLRLNRPKALHALDLSMVRQMTHALLAWRDDPDVRIVLIDHATSPDGDPKLSRGFCAGGDVVTIAKAVEGHDHAARAFFFQEYRLNHLMYTFPKPGVAFMDGVTMGGGVGIACPCRYRVATERTVFAMPETTIGIFPDVGGGRYLSRLRGRLAQYLALTGARLNGAECKALRLATHYLPSDVLDEAKARIAADPYRVEAILDELSVDPSGAPLKARLPLIDRCFASDTLADILACLDAEGDDWASATAATIRAKSPTACAVSLRMLVESPKQPHFVDEMRMEYGLMVRMIAFPDFREGVRALLIDKDGAPAWAPEAPTDAFFQPLPPEEAWSPL